MMLLLATVVAVVLGAAATALAASPSASNSAKGNSAKNKDFAGLVDIGGGRQMYMECQGKGSPTVVFVSGAGDRTETWSKTLDPSEQAVLPAIAETNRVCAYDRPGTFLVTGDAIEDFEPSRSDPVPQPTTLHDGVTDLHALLSASGERGPYVVVGHSIGGAIARLYASEYPQDVSGLVLIDYTPYNARNALTDEQWELWLPLLGSPSEEELAIYPDLEWFDPSAKPRTGTGRRSPEADAPYGALLRRAFRPFAFRRRRQPATDGRGSGGVRQASLPGFCGCQGRSSEPGARRQAHHGHGQRPLHTPRATPARDRLGS